MEVLIRAQDSSWPKGTPVTVKPDGFTWGTEEGRPGFVVIRVPLAAGQEKRLMQVDYEQVEWMDGAEQVYVGNREINLRSVRFDVDSLSPPDQNLYVMSAAEALTYLVDAETSQPIQLSDLSRDHRRTVQEDIRTIPGAPTPPESGGDQAEWDAFKQRVADGDMV